MTEIEYKIHIDHIIDRIEKARISVSEHHIVKIVAVSKYSDADAVRSLYNIGQRAFGENKVQDLKSKSEALEELPLEWHFIGNLQKNKINQLIGLNPFLFHSLDSVELAQAMQSRLADRDIVMDTLLQINTAKEATKSGVMPESANDIYAQIQSECPNLNLKGVMTIGAHSDDATLIQNSFEQTRKIYDSLNGATICSMGMSSDFELAIKCGSNMVRLGSVMFPNQ
ncbi:MAG: YggS family pyridoxal phosphate-dependent enzyme [Campylobacterota bacterium]|nr:YggS family pyridoxal phosphate-dependent enzyme [Campylobacterota bacterium]